MECEICHRHPIRDAIALYRVNAKGQPGIWRCEEHLEPATYIDPIVQDITHIIEDANLGLL